MSGTLIKSPPERDVRLAVLESTASWYSAPVQASPSELSDAARVRQLVDQHWTFVGRFLRHLGVHEELEDALQQVFITLSDKLELVEQGRERSFLAGCAVRIAARYRRKRGSEQSRIAQIGDVVDVAESPESLTEQRRLLAQLDHVLAEMSEELRSTFLLYEVEEMTMQEIADALGIPMGTVASRLRRAREIVRGRLLGHD